MKVSKTMFMVLLTVFCLAIMVVSAIPSLSSVGGYDPTLDINHDGVINMKDLGAVARAYMTTGYPAVPVTYNWTENTYSNTTWGQTEWLFYNNTAGFRKVTVSFAGYVSTGSQTYNIYVGFKCGPNTYQVDSFTDTALPINLVSNPPGVWNYTTRTYDVTGSQIWICIWNPTTASPPITYGTPITVSVSIFMTA